VFKLAACLGEADLVDLAKTKSQAHLQAISARGVLGEAVTDVWCAAAIARSRAA
jgi:uncharacterized protein (DUF2336 family)